MKKKLSIIFALIGWFALIAQFYLMVENRTTTISEMVIRFFSFFTILTNTLVATYFTLNIFKPSNGFEPKSNKLGVLTAITVYITVVGLVYQIALRHLWSPTGLQRIVDELLHTVIPILVIIYWYLYENKSSISYKKIYSWALYPLAYLVYILLRGKYPNFYPYPFVNVDNLGLSKVLINSLFILGLFVGLSAMFIRIGKALKK